MENNLKTESCLEEAIGKINLLPPKYASAHK